MNNQKINNVPILKSDTAVKKNISVKIEKKHIASKPLYLDPCIAENITCTEDAHIVYRASYNNTINETQWQCECACNEGYLSTGPQETLHGNSDSNYDQ